MSFSHQWIVHLLLNMVLKCDILSEKRKCQCTKQMRKSEIHFENMSYKVTS